MTTETKQITPQPFYVDGLTESVSKFETEPQPANYQQLCNLQEKLMRKFSTSFSSQQLKKDRKRCG